MLEHASPVGCTTALSGRIWTFRHLMITAVFNANQRRNIKRERKAVEKRACGSKL